MGEGRGKVVIGAGLTTAPMLQPQVLVPGSKGAHGRLSHCSEGPESQPKPLLFVAGFRLSLAGSEMSR